ncbi:Na+/H+ antiporter [Massospora cicadina]|nr:Na+/H+ antiporter [Massospora cicadina]
MAVDLSITLHPELVYILAALVGGFIVFFGLISLLVKEKLFLSDALVALLFGIVVGPRVLGLFDPLSWPGHAHITLELSKFAIAIQVMAAGVSMPKAYVRRKYWSFMMLLGPTMLAMWLVSGLIMMLMLPNFSYLQALIVAACVTPTDPILANSVVKGRFAEKHVPIHVRDLLSAERPRPSIYVSRVISLAYNPVADALTAWVALVWIYQIFLAVIIGIAAGYIFRKVVYYAERYDFIDKESFLAFWIALALFITGTLGILGSDDVLACFVAGNAFAWDLPWDLYESSISGLGYGNLVAIGALLLIFRRLPAMLALAKFIPAIRSLREAAPSFLAFLAQNNIEIMIEQHSSGRDALEHVYPYIYPVVSFMVLCSVVVHGITVPLLYLGRHITTRSMTASAVQNVVSRLPLIRPGQDIILVPPKPTVQEEADSSQSPSHTSVDVENEPPRALHLPPGTQVVVSERPN